MKTIHAGLLVAIFAVMATSCVENSEKYKTLLAQRDSLQSNIQIVQDSYNQSMDLLSAVDSGFAAISETEKSLKMDLNGMEGNGNSKKAEMAARFEQLKKILDENKTKVNKLQALLAAQGGKNEALAATIKRLETELADKASSITALQEELAKKDIQINELNTTVGNLNTNINALNEESKNQKQTIKEQDASLNKVWYYVGNSKSLKEAGIVTSNGLFQAKSVLDGNFNKSIFVEADKRELSSISTGSKKAKVLSNHPKDSYSLKTNDDKTVTIVISNVDKFWSVSKYLVVQK